MGPRENWRVVATGGIDLRIGSMAAWTMGMGERNEFREGVPETPEINQL